MAATSQSGTTIFRMDPPVEGGVFLVKQNEKAAWCGGKPDCDYTGRMPGQLTKPTCPSPKRFHKDTTGFDKWCKSVSRLNLKYSSDSTKFSKGFMETARERGTDSITYLHHPHDTNEMASIVEEPMLFKPDYVKT